MTKFMTDLITDQDSKTSPKIDPMTQLMTNRMTDLITNPLTDSMTDPKTDSLTDPMTVSMTDQNCNDVRAVWHLFDVLKRRRQTFLCQMAVFSDAFVFNTATKQFLCFSFSFVCCRLLLKHCRFNGSPYASPFIYMTETCVVVSCTYKILLSCLSNTSTIDI